MFANMTLCFMMFTLTVAIATPSVHTLTVTLACATVSVLKNIASMAFSHYVLTLTIAIAILRGNLVWQVRLGVYIDGCNSNA